MPVLNRDGLSLYYEVHGKGPAVVFAHGAGGNAASWYQQVPHFAPDHTVLTLDHRGFGRSPCDPSDFQPSAFADDLLAILDASSIKRAALVCQSMGGWTGMQMAVRAPERVACLVLCGTPGGIMTPALEELQKRLSSAQGPGTAGIAQLAMAPDFGEREPEREFLYSQLSAFNAGLGPEEIRRLFDLVVSDEQLADFAVPTLLLAGEHDAIFAQKDLHEVAARIPGASIYDFAGVGHSSYFEDPSTFNQIVGDFITKHLA